MRNDLSLLAVSMFVVAAIASPSHAVTHANGIKFPLNPYFLECGEDTDTESCSLGNNSNALANMIGPSWSYTDATVEIESNGRVGLRVDNLKPRSGTCPVTNGCVCSNDDGTCTTNTNCGTGNVCMAPIGFQVEVEIWGQNFVDDHPFLPEPCKYTSCIRRSFSGGDCHEVFTFETDDFGGDINATTSTGAWTCDGHLSLGPGEIRAIEVRISDPTLNGGEPELLGVMSYGRW